MVGRRARHVPAAVRRRRRQQRRPPHHQAGRAHRRRARAAGRRRRRCSSAAPAPARRSSRCRRSRRRPAWSASASTGSAPSPGAWPACSAASPASCSPATAASSARASLTGLRAHPGLHRRGLRRHHQPARRLPRRRRHRRHRGARASATSPRTTCPAANHGRLFVVAAVRAARATRRPARQGDLMTLAPSRPVTPAPEPPAAPAGRDFGPVRWVPRALVLALLAYWLLVVIPDTEQLRRRSPPTPSSTRSSGCQPQHRHRLHRPALARPPGLRRRRRVRRRLRAHRAGRARSPRPSCSPPSSRALFAAAARPGRPAHHRPLPRAHHAGLRAHPGALAVRGAGVHQRRRRPARRPARVPVRRRPLLPVLPGLPGRSSSTSTTGCSRSKAGRALLALKENERVAEAFGVNVTAFKLLAFALSGALAGVAGALFAYRIGIVVGHRLRLLPGPDLRAHGRRRRARQPARRHPRRHPVRRRSTLPARGDAPAGSSTSSSSARRRLAQFAPQFIGALRPAADASC